MNHKEEAEELVNEFIDYYGIDSDEINYSKAIKFALISINREIELLEDVYQKMCRFQRMDDDYILFKMHDLQKIEVELLKM